MKKNKTLDIIAITICGIIGLTTFIVMLPLLILFSPIALIIWAFFRVEEMEKK